MYEAASRFATCWLQVPMRPGRMLTMDPLAVTRSISLPTSADQAWRAVVDGAWLGERVDLDLVVGAAGTIEDAGVRRRALVAEMVEGASLRLLWWDEADPAVVSTVEVHVTGDDDAATVTVTERVLGGAVALATQATVADLGGAESTWDRRLRALVGEIALAPATA